MELTALWLFHSGRTTKATSAIRTRPRGLATTKCCLTGPILLSNYLPTVALPIMPIPMPTAATMLSLLTSTIAMCCSVARLCSRTACWWVGARALRGTPTSTCTLPYAAMSICRRCSSTKTRRVPSSICLTAPNALNCRWPSAAWISRAPSRTSMPLSTRPSTMPAKGPTAHGRRLLAN